MPGLRKDDHLPTSSATSTNVSDTMTLITLDEAEQELFESVE